MAKSFIHLKKANPFAFLHNPHLLQASYFIDTSRNNECNRTTKEAFDRFSKLLYKARTNYTTRTNQQVQVSDDKLIWEAVLTLDSEKTMKDVKKLVHTLEKRYGWREIQTAIHRDDEGYICQYTGRKIYNVHAHIIFFMLDAQGIYQFKSRDFGKTQMAQLQTLVATVLDMKRGESKLKTKRVHLSHSQYRQVSTEKEDLEFELRRVTAESETFLELATKEHDEKMQLLQEVNHLKVLIKTLEVTQNKFENILNELKKLDENKEQSVNKIKSIL